MAPPVIVRVPDGARITVVAEDVAATFPKLRSTVFTMLSGAIILAATEDEADVCASVTAVINDKNRKNKNCFMVVIKKQ